MAGPSEISIEPAAREARPVFERLFQLYIHDFSEMYPAEEWTIGADGAFDPYEFLESYWSTPERRPFLIRRR